MYGKKLILATVRSIAFVVVAATSVTTLTAAMSPAVFAAEKAKFSKKMIPLQDAQNLMGQKKWKEALDKINEVEAVSGKTPQETAAVNESKAYCLAQMKDIAGAAKIWEAMLGANQLPPDQVQAKILILSQIYFQQKDYAKAIQYGERYLKESGANTETMDLVARAYYLKGDYKTASDYANKLIKQAEQAKKLPEKGWYDVLMSSQFKLDNKAGILTTLEALLSDYPSQDYWRNMFKYVSNEASYSERESIEIFRLKKTLGILEAKEYIEMAELSLAMTNPGDAKAALEAGISAGVLGQAKDKERETRLLNLAKSKASQDLASLDVSAKEAQTLPKGDALAKIGAAYLGHGQNEKAASTLKSAIGKGGVVALDEAYVRLGVANLMTGKKADAVKAFQSVSSKSNLARLARLWVIYAQGKK
jgi:tetratricopeptide (TPR) repeat protein